MRLNVLFLAILIVGALGVGWFMLPRGYELAVLRMRDGDLETAVVELERQLERQAATGRVSPGLASTLAALQVDRGDPDRAIAVLATLLPEHPIDTPTGYDLRRQLADLYGEVRRWPDRLDMLRRLDALRPEPARRREIAELAGFLRDADARLAALLVLAADGTAQADERAELAERLARRGRRAEALDVLRPLLVPGGPSDVIVLAAALAVDLGDAATLDGAVTDALGTPPRADLRDALAETLAGRGATAAALSLLDGRAGGDPDAGWTGARILSAAGRPAEAVARLAALHAAGRLPDGAYVELIDDAFDLGETTLAFAVLDDALARRGAAGLDAWLLRRAAAVVDALGRRDLAAAIDRRLTPADRDRAPILAATLAMVTGDVAGALARLDAIPDDARLPADDALDVTRLLLRGGRQDRALARLRVLMAGDAADPAVLARLFVAAGAPAAALPLLDRLSGDDDDTAAVRALIAAAGGRTAVAAAWLAGARDAPRILDLFTVATEAGHRDLAAAAARSLAALSPGDRTAALRLAGAEMDVGRPAAAAAALATVPDDPRATEEVRLRASVEVATGATARALDRLAAHCADGAPCGPALRDLVDLALGADRPDVAAGAIDGRVVALLAAGTVEGVQVAAVIAGLFAAGDAGRADRLAREAGPAVLADRPVLAARLARIRGVGADLRTWLAAARQRAAAGGLDDLDRLDLALLLSETGDPAAALDERAALARLGRLPPFAASDTAALYDMLGRAGEGADLFAGLRRGRPDPAFDAAWARLSAFAGRHAAVTEWLARPDARPDAQLLRDLAYLGLDAPAPDLAAAATRRLSATVDDAEARTLRARAELAVGRPAAAMAALAPDLATGDAPADVEAIWLDAATRAGRSDAIADHLLVRTARADLDPAAATPLLQALDAALDATPRDRPATAPPLAERLARELDAGTPPGAADVDVRLRLLARLDPVAGLARLEAAARRDPATYGDTLVETLRARGDLAGAARAVEARLAAGGYEPARRPQAVFDLIALAGAARALPFVRPLALAERDEGGVWVPVYLDTLVATGRTEEARSFLRARAARPGQPPARVRETAFRLLDLGDRAAAETLFAGLARTGAPDGPDADQLLYLWGPRPTRDRLDLLEDIARTAAPDRRIGWLRRLADAGAARRASALLAATAPVSTADPRSLDLWIDLLERDGPAADPATVEAALRRELASGRRPDRLGRLAGLAEATGRTGAAADAWDAVLAGRPDDRPALLARARIAYAADRRAEARALYDRAFAAGTSGRTGRDEAQALYQSGELLAQAREPAAARRRFEAAVAALGTPADDADRALLGLALHRLGRSDDGLGHLKDLLARRPGDDNLRADVASVLLQLGRTEEARTVLRGR